MLTSYRAIACFISIVVASHSSAAAQASNGARFYSLGDLAGGAYGSYAFGVSDDGKFVVGFSEAAGMQEAVIWTESTGIRSIGGVTGNNFTTAHSISSDGSVIAGVTSSNLGGNVDPFRWTAEEGFVPLSGCGCHGPNYRVTVSGNGGIITGSRPVPGTGVSGYRWTAATGPVDIGDFPGGNAFSLALDVTRDGRVIVGSGNVPGGVRGFRWTRETGLVELGELMYQADAISADGLAIAGVGFQDGQGAVRWTEAEGPVWLGHLPGLTENVFSFASDISGDGSVIVGGSGENARFQAFRWTRQSGMRSVQQMLSELGVITSGWMLGAASGVSADGSVIIGNGVNPQGQPEGWVAVLSPSYVPEPTTACHIFAALISVIGGLARRRWSLGYPQEREWGGGETGQRPQAGLGIRAVLRAASSAYLLVWREAPAAGSAVGHPRFDVVLGTSARDHLG